MNKAIVIIKIIAGLSFLTYTLFISSLVGAVEKGGLLPPLIIQSEPVNFSYEPNGEMQLILIYPLKYSSRKIGQFNRRVIAAGFCPKSIIDMKNRAWYAPLPIARKHIKKEIENSPDPSCSVTADYEQAAKNFWQLEGGAVLIVVDGLGFIQHMSYGIPDKKQEKKIIALLKGVDREN